MKSEDNAWHQLRQQAAAQLTPTFADRVVRAARGPQPVAWQQMQAHAAAQIRPGFAERVLRAARILPGVPSLFDQFALSAATAAVCLGAVVIAHSFAVKQENERNLAAWQQLAADAQDFEAQSQ